MKILIIAPDLPYPPIFGGMLRNHGIIESLRLQGHDVTLVCHYEGKVPAVPEDLRVFTVRPPERTRIQRLRDLLLTNHADIARRLYSQAFVNILTELLTNEIFDLVQFEGLEMACYQPLVAQLQPSAKQVFDAHNAEYNLQQAIFDIDRKQPKRWLAALYSYLQIGRIHRFEREICQKVDAVVAVSQEDALLLQDFRADHHITIMPNGIWVDRYQGGAQNPFQHERNIVFTGKMDYRPNVDAVLWFAHEILPHLTDIHFTIVGQQPHPRLEALRGLPNVTITGQVESVLPYLQHTMVYIAPLRMGSGTRLKLLEAMACGCAIVTTQIGASGLSNTARSVMLIRDEAKAFAKAVDDLLNDETARHRYSRLARQTVADTYDWGVLIPRLLAVYSTIGVYDG